ncbi:hypothetical protein HYW59_03300 [Candidatus Kaiserbacteria bacterium]|nr:hypothetical protein [Candidatus Kaiserbacteria bacterium]
MTDASKKLLAILAVLQNEFELGYIPFDYVYFDAAALEKVAQLNHLQIRRVLEQFMQQGLITRRIFHSREDAAEEDMYQEDTWAIQFPTDFLSRAKEYEEKVFGEKKLISPPGTHLYIDKDGNFWCEPKGKLCYAMEATSDRFRILSHLVENDGYRMTGEIAERLERKNKQQVRTEIAKIRKNIKKFLKIDGGEVIQGKKDSGYRINPAYKVIKV